MPSPIFGGHHIMHVGSNCGHNQTCQISSESVQGLRSTRGRKWPFPLTWHIALTTVCTHYTGMMCACAPVQVTSVSRQQLSSAAVYRCVLSHRGYSISHRTHSINAWCTVYRVRRLRAHKTHYVLSVRDGPAGGRMWLSRLWPPINDSYMPTYHV